jgi:hypothetical protein
VLLILFCISSGVLGLLLVIREFQNQRMIKSLLDRILENHGMAALPESHPVADMLNKLKEQPQTEQQRRVIKAAQEGIQFKIPGMPTFRGK